MVKAIVGANWGDEGKGKITDMMAQEADIVVRFQGGANAGHTIVNEYGKFALHTLPSGVFYSHITNIIGNGVALNIPLLMKEYQSIVDRKVPTPKLLVSDRAQIVMPYHILFDQYEEERLGGKSFGSTKSGIAPFYSDKYAKIGFQVSELFDEEILKEKAARICEIKNVLLEHLYHKPLLHPGDLLHTLHEYRDMIAPYAGDVSAFLDKALKEGKTILLEGQLGTLKDPDHGIYPMVTSSSTLAAFGAMGFLPMKSGRLSPSARHILPQWARARSSPSSSERKRRSCAAGEETAENTAPPQDVPGVWDGSTAWPPNTAAACREPRMWPSPCWMYWGIWMKSPYAPATRSTGR